jgi:hypothetical protein
MDEMSDEQLRDFAEKRHRDLERFNRQQLRRQRIAYWGLIPYALGALATGVGVANVLDAGLRTTFIMLVFGFVTLVGMQWIAPIVTRRLDRKD